MIVANAPAALPAKAATNSIPIVFNTGFDPVKFGLVASLNKPGGNATGVTQLGSQLGPKRLELMHVLLPNANHFSVLVNPSSPSTESQLTALLPAARDLGVQLDFLNASGEPDFNAVFATLVQSRASGLLVNADAYFNSQIARIAALALRHAIPAIYQYPEFAVAGGLMSYGTSLIDAFRLVGEYAGRIIKGEKPADLPVQQSTKFNFVINLKTAKALGLTVPQTLLATADEVIE